jgi:O-antigen ligase
MGRNKNILKNLIIVSAILGAVLVLIMNVPQLYNIIGVRIVDAFNIASGNEQGTEDVSRLMLAMMGLDWFMDKPILGYGINCFRALSDNTSLFAGKNFYAHNNYIELMVDIGIIGMLVYYYAHIHVLKKYFRLKKNSNEISKAILILLFVIMFSDIFWVAYYNDLSQFLLCITFTIIHLENSSYRKEKVHEKC